MSLFVDSIDFSCSHFGLSAFCVRSIDKSTVIFYRQFFLFGSEEMDVLWLCHDNRTGIGPECFHLQRTRLVVESFAAKQIVEKKILWGKINPLMKENSCLANGRHSHQQPTSLIPLFIKRFEATTVALASHFH